MPWELSLTLRAGTVYYFVHRGTTSSEPHYFVILNANPRQDSLLLMSIASSQIEKVKARRKGLPGKTLVEISAVEFDPFTRETIIDCNQVFELGMRELIEKFNSRELRHCDDIPDAILEKIIDGAMASPMVSEEHKNLIRCTDG